MSSFVPTGIIGNKRDGSNLDSALNVTLIQRRKLNHSKLTIFTTPWEKPNIINDTLKKLISTPPSHPCVDSSSFVCEFDGWMGGVGDF